MKKQSIFSTQTLVMSAIMTAFVVVFQLLGNFVSFFGPFSTALSLIPISIGAMLCGPVVGAWLGFVFGVVVLITGGANLFLAFDVPGTLVTVMVKGICCGLVSGLVFKLIKKFNEPVAAVTASLVCPLVNTSLFILGCAVFFLDDVTGIAAQIGSPDAGMKVFLGLAGANFIFEICMSTIISPITTRLIRLRNIKK